MAIMDLYHFHVGCGGRLVVHHIEKKQVGKGKNKKILEREYYECDKCGAVMQCTLMDSYDQMVLKHMIHVPFAELRRIKRKYDLWEER